MHPEDRNQLAAKAPQSTLERCFSGLSDQQELLGKLESKLEPVSRRSDTELADTDDEVELHLRNVAAVIEQNNARLAITLENLEV